MILETWLFFLLACLRVEGCGCVWPSWLSEELCLCVLCALCLCCVCVQRKEMVFFRFSSLGCSCVGFSFSTDTRPGWTDRVGCHRTGHDDDFPFR